MAFPLGRLSRGARGTLSGPPSLSPRKCDEVGYTQRVALEFSGSLFPHAICLGDVDNDTVSACALQTQSSAHAGRGQGRGRWPAPACVGVDACRRLGGAACVRAHGRLGEMDWEGPCGQLCAASWPVLVRSPGPCLFRGSRNGSAAWFNDLCSGGTNKLRGRLPCPFRSPLPFFRARKINTSARAARRSTCRPPSLARPTGRL